MIRTHIEPPARESVPGLWVDGLSVSGYLSRANIIGFGEWLQRVLQPYGSNTGQVYGEPTDDPKTIEAIHAMIDLCAAAVKLIGARKPGQCESCDELPPEFPFPHCKCYD